MRHVNLFEKNGGVLQEYVENLKCIPGRQLWGRWSPFMKNYHSQKHSETLIDHAHRQIYIKF